MKKVLSILSALLLITSCTFHEPDIVGLDDIKMGEIKGREITFDVTARIKNDNTYGIKVKPSTLDVYVGDEYMGEIHLDKKVKFKKKQTTTVTAPFTATLAEGAMFKAMALLNKSQIELRLTGKVKAGVWFVSKKIDVNERKTIDGSSLKNMVN